MITLYTNKKAAEKTGKKLIYFVDLFFDKEIYHMKLNKTDEEIMKNIDTAKLLDNGMIQTIFGVTEIQNLSTGCKTLILLNHRKEFNNPIINICECGANVLDYVFAANDIEVLLEFMLIPHKYDSDKIIKVIGKKYNKEKRLWEVFSNRWIG